MSFGGFLSMWVIAMFDLPVDTKKARKAYRNMRKALLNDGFTILQFSVYARHTPSIENATGHEDRVRIVLPDDGEVRLLTITDKQFERMNEGISWKNTEGYRKSARTTHFFLSCSGTS